jgi:Xaa-Pro dipeptidase
MLNKTYDETRIAQIVRFISESPFSCIVAVSPESVSYLGGIVVDTHRHIPRRIAAVVWPNVGEPTFIIPRQLESRVKESSWIPKVAVYDEMEQSPITVLSDVLVPYLVGPKPIAVEKGFLVADFYEELLSNLHKDRLPSCDTLLKKIRMRKTPWEIEKIKMAFLATDRAFFKMLSLIGEGDSEKKISRLLQDQLLDEGADQVRPLLLLGAGPNTIRRHHLPGEYQLKMGDLLISDFGGIFNGYVTDLARTAVAGRAAPKQQSIYQWLWGVEQELINSILPGMEASQLFKKCQQLFGEEGLKLGTEHVGHGVGLGLHEPPTLNAKDSTVLEPGMVICLEPNVVVLERSEKYLLEDLILITDNEPIVLSRSRDWAQLSHI